MYKSILTSLVINSQIDCADLLVSIGLILITSSSWTQDRKDVMTSGYLRKCLLQMLLKPHNSRKSSSNSKKGRGQKR